MVSTSVITIICLDNLLQVNLLFVIHMIGFCAHGEVGDLQDQEQVWEYVLFVEGANSRRRTKIEYDFLPDGGDRSSRGKEGCAMEEVWFDEVFVRSRYQ